MPRPKPTSRPQRSNRPVDFGVFTPTKGKGWRSIARFNPKSSGRIKVRGFVVTDKVTEQALLRKGRKPIGVVGPKGGKFKVFKERRKT